MLRSGWRHASAWAPPNASAKEEGPTGSQVAGPSPPVARSAYGGKLRSLKPRMVILVRSLGVSPMTRE
jgi:hypothetical protein